MPQGGRLSLTARQEREAGSGSRDFVAIEFADTGVGIPRESLGRVFEAFYTTKEPGKGTGLGLSVSYGIVTNHGGRIEAFSKGPGQGAVFTIWLPAAVALGMAQENAMEAVI